MGKTTISMAIFNSYVKLPEGSLLVSMGLSTYSPAKNRFFLQGIWPIGHVDRVLACE